MTESTALVPITPVRSLVVGVADVANYQAAIMAEARSGFAAAEAALSEAEQAVSAAYGANEFEQVRGWRSQVTRRRKRRDRIAGFIKVLDAGYLPIPRLPGVRLETLPWRGNKNALIPAEALEALAEAKKVEGFEAFELVDGRDEFGRSRMRRQGRDPILVGIVNGEMFPIAWWR